MVLLLCYHEAMPGSRASAEYDLPKQPGMVLMDVPAVLVYADGKVGEARRQRGQYGATVARPFHAKPADRHEISVEVDDRRGDNLTISDVNKLQPPALVRTGSLQNIELTLLCVVFT